MPEYRILVVEDEEGIALHTQFILKKLGYVPLGPVARGDQAVEQAGVLRPDLILMDINLLDGQTGISAAREINTRFDIPVIFLSGVSDEEVLLDMRDSNPYAYLLKPIQQQELRAAIELAIYKHRMENRLRASEARYHRLFETMTSGFILFDVLFNEQQEVYDYQVVDINPALIQLMHTDRASVIGVRMSQVPHYGMLKPYIDLYPQILATHSPVNVEWFEPFSQRYLDIRAYVPAPGQLALLVHDVTERRRSEQRIAESELRFRQLAETVNEVFWLRSRHDNQVLYVNPAYERIWDRKAEDLYASSQSFLESVHPEDLPNVLEAQKDMTETGTMFDEEYRIIRPDGSQRWIWARTYPVREADGEISHYSGIAEDITERKRADEELLHSYHLTEQALRRMTVLRNIDTAITTHTDLMTMIQTVLDLILDLEEVDAALMFYPRGNELRLVGTAGLARDSLSPFITHLLSREASQVFQTGFPSIHQGAGEGSPRNEAASLSATISTQLGYNAFFFLPLTTKGEAKGVLLLLRRISHNGCPANNPQNFFESLALQAAIAIDNVELFQGYIRSNSELRRAYDETIKGWAQALELRSADTRGHCDRVVELSEHLALAMGMSEEELVHFRRGVMLHDIGKLGIPDRILLKNGSLNEEEWAAIRMHPVYGYQMLRDIEYLRPAVDVPYCHHERWDGTGYPRGLKGTKIPRSARIFAVVDAWDALVNERPYHPAWPPQDAIDYLKQQSGKQFDPEVVQVFLSLINGMELLAAPAVPSRE